jgi:hypothetical protein
MKPGSDKPERDEWRRQIDAGLGMIRDLRREADLAATRGEDTEPYRKKEMEIRMRYGIFEGGLTADDMLDDE